MNINYNSIMIDTVALVIIAIMSTLTGIAALLVLIAMFSNHKTGSV